VDVPDGYDHDEHKMKFGWTYDDWANYDEQMDLREYISGGRLRVGKVQKTGGSVLVHLHQRGIFDVDQGGLVRKEGRMEQWEYDWMFDFPLAAPKKDGVKKHLLGLHDQKKHGRKAGGYIGQVLRDVGPARIRLNFAAAFRTETLAPYKAFVTHYSAKDLAGMKTYTVERGKAGMAVKVHGDGRIEGTAAFNTSSTRGVAAKMLYEAIETDGVNYLECYGEDLRRLYESIGFVVQTEDKFNDEYASPDWDYQTHNHPNYYTLTLRGENVTKTDNMVQAMIDAAQREIDEMEDGPEKTQRENLLAAAVALS
jgi:hypothetical protein